MYIHIYRVCSNQAMLFRLAYGGCAWLHFKEPQTSSERRALTHQVRILGPSNHSVYAASTSTSTAV